MSTEDIPNFSWCPSINGPFPTDPTTLAAIHDIVRAAQAHFRKENAMTQRFADPTPRTFTLIRDVDETGISGTGAIASGCQWPDGTVALRWNTDTASTTLFDSVGDMLAVHGHSGATRVEWSQNQVMSNQTINDQRLTWQQVCEELSEENRRLRERDVILSDLDRCEHGRHKKDNCSMCDANGGNKGNPRLSSSRIIGFDIGGKPYKVPETGTHEPAEKWRVEK